MCAKITRFLINKIILLNKKTKKMESEAVG